MLEQHRAIHSWRSPAHVKKSAALAERLNAATKQAQDARQRAQAAATKLGEIAVRARPVHGDIITRAGRIGGAEAEQAVGTANGLYGAINSWHGAAVACVDAAAKAQTQANEGAAGGAATPGQVLAGIDALLGGKDPGKLVSDLTTGADTTKSYVDIAEVMEEAARSAAEGAETCRKLAESALTQQSGDDLVAAAEAAIGICEFEKARSAIDALPAGPIRDRIADRYRASVAREQAVRALYEEARALYRGGDTAAALAKLAAARAQTACDKYAVVIDQTTAQIRAGSTDTRVGTVQSAIADCRFEEARTQIDALTADHHPQASTLAAEYASAYQREQRTIALWDEARALFSKGQRAEATARLNQALANTRCSTYRSRIGAAIATLSRDSNRRETDTEQGEIEPGWTTAWKGSFRLGQIRVNGRDVDAPTLLRLIRENWLYAAEKAQQESKAGRKGVTKSILGDMEQEIGRAVVGLVMAGVDLLNQGLDWSFQMRPEANGYRLMIPGNSPAAQKMSKGMATYPLFIPDGERRLRLNYRKAGSNTTISALMSADDKWSRVSFTISIKGDMSAKDSDYVNAIRSIDLNIDGAFEPGSIPAEQLKSQLSTKFQTTSKRYADELKR